jgi:signal transduction histidine kinase/CheY-like chemotaxis protein
VGTGRTIAVFECEILTKHGHRVTIEIQGAPRWQDGRVVGIQGIGRDVTERRRLEEQLRQAQKMDAIGRLAGGVAHDFNNLLTVIQGRADLLLAQMAPGDRLREPLELIHRTAGRAADLTQRLLAFGRRQVLRPRVLDLGAVLHDLAPMLRSLVREDIELSLEMAPGIVRVRADPGQLEQVVVNLVVNARDAMPRGGRVSIALAVTADGDPGRPSAERQRPQAALRFSDTGDGMDAETRARVFEPFFTTKDVGKGTGLGLATVYGIVTQSGGRVTVESDLGRGTTFTVLLPIVDDEPSTAPDTDERREPSRGKGRILIVEDEPEVLALAADILQARGYTVVSAGGPEEALAWMAQHPGSMDLLLTDVVMPRMSGPELATRIEAMCPGVRVVYMSGYAADASGHHSVFDFGAGFVQKPFTSEDLSRKIRDALARETP